MSNLRVQNLLVRAIASLQKVAELSGDAPAKTTRTPRAAKKAAAGKAEKTTRTPRASKKAAAEKPAAKKSTRAAKAEKATKPAVQKTGRVSKKVNNAPDFD